MERILDEMITTGIQGSIVILAVIVLRFLLRETPKKYICLLWLMAGLRLLWPIQIRSDFSLQPKFTLPLAELAALKWMPVLLRIWAVVAIGFLVYSAVSYLKLKKRVREAVRIQGGWESDKIDTAFILGFIKPQIYIPMGMSHQARKHILEHERTHLDKGDHVLKILGFVALARHWFNPLVWVAYILLCKDIEMACDERVVQFMELDERKSYSAALLSCSSRKAHYGVNPVAFGEVSVKQRIVNVLNYKKPSFWFSLLGVVAFFFVAICLLTSPEKNAQLPDAYVPVQETMAPEEQARQEQLRKCQDDMVSLFSGEDFYYDILATNERGTVLFQAEIYKQGADTMWKYDPNSSPDVTEGRLELDGQHYAWQSGGWMLTDTKDSEFADWIGLFGWSTENAQLLEDSGDMVKFTTKWEGEDRSVHTATQVYAYDEAGNLTNIQIENPDHPKADYVYLHTNPFRQQMEGEKSTDELFADAAAAVTEGFVSAEALAEQKEISSWGVFFRVDDDNLSSKGSDVYYSQDEYGFGSISTTKRYWLEKKVNGTWETVPTITEPNWEYDQEGVSRAGSIGYLDWTPLYGELEPGEYRMGKIFKCNDDATRYTKERVFYSEFVIFAVVDSASPEAKAAVERCYDAVDALKARTSLHWLEMRGSGDWEECWFNGGDYLRKTKWNGPEISPDQWSDHDKELFPRVDTNVRYHGVRYAEARKDPDILNSEVIGMSLLSLASDRSGWDEGVAGIMGTSLFDRSNHTAAFPEGVGMISDEEVCFVRNWTTAMGTDHTAQLTYRFDDEGNLCYMEYKSDEDYVTYIQVFDDTAEQIDAAIKPYTEELVVRTFSWEEAKAKYTADEFEIRQDGFVNTAQTPVTDPVEAARLALKEYPNLGEYLSLDVSRDKEAGIWKVTVESYVDYQSTYGYRDVYLSDSGITQLLVYEGPIDFDQPRK